MLLSRSRALIKALSPHHDFIKFKSISTFPFLSQEAQLAEESPPPPSQSTTTPLPPNPAAGSPYYGQNWRSPYPPPPPPPPSTQSSSLIPLAYSLQTSQMQSLSETLDVKGLMDVFAECMTSQKWVEIKQLFEFWVRSLDKDGKPNKPDVNLYNHYLRANFMRANLMNEEATAGYMMDLVSQMEDFGISPNTASFNLVLNAMSSHGEAEAAVKLLERLLFILSYSLKYSQGY